MTLATFHEPISLEKFVAPLNIASKEVTWATFHELSSWLKADAPSNMPFSLSPAIACVPFNHPLTAG